MGAKAKPKKNSQVFRYADIFEDLMDGLVVSERAEEPTVTLEQVEKRFNRVQVGKEAAVGALDTIYTHMTPEHQQELLDFALFLKAKESQPKKKRKLSFKWAGALSHLKDQYTAVELQKKAAEWRKG